MLCTFVLRPSGKLSADLRLQSLTIMRNFAFNTTCRPALVASDELMYVLKCVVDDGTPAEHLIVTIIIWRLVANCYKAKHTFRCGSVLDSVWSLKNRIGDSCDDTDDDQTTERREVAMVIDALRLMFEK